MNSMLNIFGMLSSIFELGTIVFFGYLIFDKKEKYKIKTISIILLLFVFEYIWSCFDLPVYTNYIKSSLEFALILWLLYKTSIKEVLFYIIIYLLVIEITDIVITCILSYIFSSNYGTVNFEVWGRLCGMFLSDISVFLMLWYTAFLAGKYEKNLSGKYIAIILLYPLLSYVLLLIIDNLMIAGNIANPLYMIVPLAILMYIIFVVFDFFEAYASKTELELLNEIDKQRAGNYRVLEGSEKELRILKHDIAKQLAVISEQLNSQSRKEICVHVNELQEKFDKVGDYIYTSNETLDTILNLGCRRAKLNNVKYKCFVGIEGEISLKKSDLTSLLTNLIDNAIEASLKVKDPFITINILQYSNDLKIEIRNSSILVSNLKDTLTTKHDKVNHGYGLKSINKVLDIYNGTRNDTYNNGVLETQIVLRNCFSHSV